MKKEKKYLTISTGYGMISKLVQELSCYDALRGTAMMREIAALPVTSAEYVR